MSQSGDKKEKVLKPVTEESNADLKGDNPAQTLRNHDEAGSDLSTEDWIAHMKTDATSNDTGPIIREMPDYEGAGGTNGNEEDGSSDAGSSGFDAEPKYNHKINRNDNIGETMDAQANMAVTALELPTKFGGWAITQSWDDPRTKMDDELKGFLVQVMKPVIAKRRNIFSDEVFFYAGVLVYLVWCVSTLVLIWKDKKAQVAKQKEIEEKEAEIAELREMLEQQANSYHPEHTQSNQAYQQQSHVPSPPMPERKRERKGLKLYIPNEQKNKPVIRVMYKLGGTAGTNRAPNRDKYLIDEDGKFCYPPIGWKGDGLAKNGIIMKANRVGELRFMASLDDMDYIVHENRIRKGEQKDMVAFSRIFKAFQDNYPDNQHDKLKQLIQFHIDMQRKYLSMK